MPTPQRLPIVNSDDGTWGDIIRQFLMKEHLNDDTDNAVNGGHQKITVKAGTTAAGTAPIKLTSGSLMTAAEVGGQGSLRAGGVGVQGTREENVLFAAQPLGELHRGGEGHLAVLKCIGERRGSELLRTESYHHALASAEPLAQVSVQRQLAERKRQHVALDLTWDEVHLR